MIENIDLGTKSLEIYRSVVSDELLEEIHGLAADLKSARIVHVNATANGGGVSETLRSLVPLYQDLGIDASWLVMQGDDPFFAVTKKMHNALQGADQIIEPAEWDVYMKGNSDNAASLSPGYDVVFLHDPQPAAVLRFARQAAAHWVWRCHIDTSTPNAEVWRELSSLLEGFDAGVFSIADYVGPGLQLPRVSIIPPAIDPDSPKNRPMSREKAVKVVAKHGVDPSRPFIAQVSRFDPWKDPLGVVECFRQLRARNSDLQLVLLGNFADDDPEGAVIYEQVLKAIGNMADVHVITGLTDQVNPFQSLSQVVIQKSLREGFGLTVAEALWKRTPVVAGNVGGIRLQIEDGVSGYLVDSIEECAQRVDYLLNHEAERLTQGEAGREHVRSNFLTPRLLRDELALARDLLA